MNPLNSNNSPVKQVPIIIPNLQMRNLRQREIKKFRDSQNFFGINTPESSLKVESHALESGEIAQKKN